MPRYEVEIKVADAAHEHLIHVEFESPRERPAEVAVELFRALTQTLGWKRFHVVDDER